MARSLEEIQGMLDALPHKEFRFDIVRQDALTYTGALRTAEGQNVVEPSTESSSMVVGLRASIEFLQEAPQIVQQLLDTIEHNSGAQTAKKAPEEDLKD